MKKKLQIIKERVNEIDTLCYEHPLYKVLASPISHYEKKVTPFKLTQEQLLYVCLWVLDCVRSEKCNSNEDCDGIFYGLFEDYKKMAPKRCPKKSIAFAVLVSMRAALFCLKAIRSMYDLDYECSVSCLEETINRYGNAYDNNREKLEEFFEANQYTDGDLWCNNFVPFLKQYMEGDKSIWEEINEKLHLDEMEGINLESEEIRILKEAKKRDEERIMELEEQLAMGEKENLRASEKFNICHIVILFEALLGKRAVPLEMNITAFSSLLAKVSGYNNKSIDNKIPSTGLDYQKPHVRQQANEVIRCLEKVSPEVAERIREKLKTPPKEKK